MRNAADPARVRAVDVAIGEGYRPGLIGEVVALHARTYSRWAGSGSAFEGDRWGARITGQTFVRKVTLPPSPSR